MQVRSRLKGSYPILTWPIGWKRHRRITLVASEAWTRSWRHPVGPRPEPEGSGHRDLGLDTPPRESTLVGRPRLLPHEIFEWAGFRCPVHHSEVVLAAHLFRFRNVQIGFSSKSLIGRFRRWPISALTDFGHCLGQNIGQDFGFGPSNSWILVWDRSLILTCPARFRFQFRFLNRFLNRFWNRFRNRFDINFWCRFTSDPDLQFLDPRLFGLFDRFRHGGGFESRSFSLRLPRFYGREDLVFWRSLCGLL